MAMRGFRGRIYADVWCGFFPPQTTRPPAIRTRSSKLSRDVTISLANLRSKARLTAYR
jgi:hypothetical protein